MDKEKKIFVFADFQPYHEEIIGTIYVSQTRGKEFYSFEYDQKWLEKGNMILDPDLQMYKGRQYIHDDKKIFGVFADSCPNTANTLLCELYMLTCSYEQYPMEYYSTGNVHWGYIKLTWSTTRR